MKVHNVMSTSIATHLVPEKFGDERSMAWLNSQPGININKGYQVVKGSPTESVTGYVSKFPFVAVAVVLIVDCRFMGCKICYLAAYVPLVVPVYGQNEHVSKGKEVIDNLGTSAAVLWVMVALIIVSLVICYRFSLWRKCYDKAYKYLVVPRCEQPHIPSIILVEEPIANQIEELCPTQKNCPVQETVYPDVDVRDFISHVKHLKRDGDHGFSQEFLEINEASRNYSFSSENFNMSQNQTKNRYTNIVVYDHSRVILKTESSTDQSDYINASYVHGYKKTEAYIATQGPLPQTVSDFWRMVWEQNSNVIVMITNLMEKGMSKCEQYWPTKGVHIYGNVTVRLLSTQCRVYYVVRIFLLTDIQSSLAKDTAARLVYHYHYTHWPDHGVPEYTLPVLSFVLKSAAQNRRQYGPVIVHCSAGVGRTGTYILIDSMIAQIMDKRSVNIPGFILDIRRQRNLLVQTEAQYKFIHEVLVEYLLANGTTEVRVDQMSDYVKQLEQPFRSLFQPIILQTSLLEKHFQQITEHTSQQFEFEAALQPINQSKNRVGGILPACSSRVLLPPRPGVGGSDYINATFLQGYTKAAEFIVTQHPLDNTVDDFWKMVWHVKSPVIVVLLSSRDKESREFWPPKDVSRILDMESLCITTKNEPVLNREQNTMILEIVVEFKKDGSSMLTRLMVVKDWLFRYKKLHKLFDPISATCAKLTPADCGPVIVVDRFGGVEAGTFCALWTLRDQVLSEKCADFYQVCKLYHYKRPGIFRSQDNYLFLHCAVNALCKHLQAQSTTKHCRHSHHHLPSYHDHIYSNGSFSVTTTAINNSEA